jgi:hypothetical protein
MRELKKGKPCASLTKEEQLIYKKHNSLFSRTRKWIESLESEPPLKKKRYSFKLLQVLRLLELEPYDYMDNKKIPVRLLVQLSNKALRLKAEQRTN